jgi:hypothetical protein
LGESFFGMTCRLFIDEVGNDDVSSPAEQYLSVSGIYCKVRHHDTKITPIIEAVKTKFFGHDPVTNPVILHRRELVRKEKPFEALRDEVLNKEWEAATLAMLSDLPYLAVTVMIDKHEHKDRYKVWLFNPYHYCLTAILERYVSWLKRNGETGDVIAEARHKKVDKALKRAFEHFWNNGTANVPAKVVQAHLTSKELKLATKKENVCGLQLVELIAHASHHGTKEKQTGVEAKASFGKQIYAVLERSKYCRKPSSGLIAGWGQKWLP